MPIFQRIHPLLISVAFVLCFGCVDARKSKLDAKATLRTVWSGVLNYSNAFGSLPPQNDNAWRFSESTRYKTVPWRGLVLTRIAAVGDRDGKLTAYELEEQIDRIGKHCFSVGDALIYSNFLNVGVGPLEALPPKMVLGYTALPIPGECWMSEETRKLSDFQQDFATMRFPSAGVYLLFCDGSIGHVENQNIEVMTSFFGESPAASSGNVDLEKLGIQLIAEPQIP